LPSPMRSNKEKRNVILTGFMATGKSSVGKQLAARLGYEFLDLDSLIETEVGMKVAEIFDTLGEAEFRSLETRMVAGMAGRRGCVLATGGGTMADPDNRRLLRDNGAVIALTADPDIILERAGEGRERPLLRGENKEERIRHLLAQRAHAYAEADLLLDTSSLSVDQAVDRLLDWLRQHGIGRGVE